MRLIGFQIYEKFPDLIELSDAASEAKDGVRRRWKEIEDSEHKKKSDN